jgi:hypothetical protein
MDEISKLSLTQAGMAQFETMHSPIQANAGSSFNVGTIICNACDEDWPCERMGVMLMVQAMAMIQSMIPTGNMASVLQRFSSLQR